MTLKRLLLNWTTAAVVLIALLLAGGTLFLFWSGAFPSAGEATTVRFTRGNFTVFDFPAARRPPTALLLFASGDGGWSSLEEAICRGFQKQGYEVVGIDSQAYAKTDYDLDTLQADFSTLARIALSRDAGRRPPLIVGGYSMGGAQAIAVAGGPHPPEGLVGLLIVDACSRGRYGLRRADQLDVLPTGDGTFSVDSFGHAMDALRVVQWHAEQDNIDSLAWLDTLGAEHRAFTFPATGHHYDIGRADFIRQLVGSAAWITAPRKAAK